MPTEDGYRGAAEALRNSAGRIDEDLPPIDKDWSDAVQGGVLAELVPEAVSAATTNGRSVVDKILALADVCDDRADQCVEYEGKVKEYNEDLDEYYIKLSKYEPDTRAIKPRKPDLPATPPSWLESRVALGS